MSKKKPKKLVNAPVVANQVVPDKDKSPKVFQRDKLSKELHIAEREMTDKQKEFVALAMDKNTKCIVVKGPAGTAKTYYAIYAGLKLMSRKNVSDLLYLRSAVECSDDKIGFLPGEKEEKLAPYIQPLIEKLQEQLPKAEVDLLIKEERIANIPMGYLRGLSWNARFVVLDEAQDVSFKDLRTAITRVGEFSKLMILGDAEQIDIKNSGFNKLFNGLKGNEEDKANGVHTFEFTDEDCVRSAFVKYMIKRLREIEKTN